MLSAFFRAQKPFLFTETKLLKPFPLEIYDFTYLHFHDCLEIGYCIEGEGICRVDDKEYPFKAGDVQVIFPFQKHLSRSKKDNCSLWYFLSINPYALMEQCGFTSIAKIEHIISKEMGLCGIFTPEEHPVIVESVTNILDKINTPNQATPYYTELCATYVYQLLIQLASHSQHLPKLTIEHDRNIHSVVPAIDLISESVKKGVIPSVESLANSCGMSVSHFRRVFRNIIGLAPKEYITKSLLNKAQKLLLTTDKSILEISMETGFQDISGFNRHFLSKTNMTPSEFRKTFTLQ